MPPDRVRQALDDLRETVEDRLGRVEAAMRDLSRDTGEHQGRLEALHHRLESVATRVHTHGNRLQVLASESQLSVQAHRDGRYVTWNEAKRIIVAAVGLAGILFTAISWVLDRVGGP